MPATADLHPPIYILSQHCDLIPCKRFLAIIDAMTEPRTYSTSDRKKSVAAEPVTSVLEAGQVPVYERELTADEEVLAALGYKPEFKREFSLWTTFCVSFAVLGLLPSFASTLYYVRFVRQGFGGWELMEL